MGDRLPMEKRKGVTLRALLARYLLMTGALLALLAAAAWSRFVLLMTGGFILPASSGQQAALQSAARLRQEGAFDAAALDPLCGYVYFDGGGGVAQSNLPQKRLDDAQRMLRGQEQTSLLGAAWYYERVEFADGGFCLLQYDYSVPYGDPALRGRLPAGAADGTALLRQNALAAVLLAGGSVGGNLLLTWLAGRVDASYLFPLVQGSIIVGVTLCSVLLFREKLSARGRLGILLGVAAIAVINL